MSKLPKLTGIELGKIIEYDKELRIDNQYYLKNRPVDFNPKKLSTLLLDIKNFLDSLTAKDITQIRKIIEDS